MIRLPRRVLVLACSAGMTAALPAAAGAHSLVRVQGQELHYVSSDATSLNSLTARASGDDIELRDPTVDGGIDPGPCRPGELSEDANAWIVQVFCRRGAVTRLRVDLADREDRATLELPVPVTVLGGSGADQLRTGAAADRIDGGEGNDTLAGGEGDDALDGGVGRDRLDAGPGDDTVDTRDGLRDGVACGPGQDAVDADTLDDVAADCERVARTLTPPPADGGDDDRTAPTVRAGAATVQRVSGSWRVRIAATSSERGSIAASGFLDAAGLSLPLQSDRRRVMVGGGAADLAVRLTGRARRAARRALRRDRRVTVRMSVVATDLAGNSAQVRAPRIGLVGGRRAVASHAPIAAASRCSGGAGPVRGEPGEEDGGGDRRASMTSHDQDCDGIDDFEDNCPPRFYHDPGTANTDQRDSDGDGDGDRCDPDADNDGIPNEEDNCRSVANPAQEPSPTPGVGAKCYSDSDGDGLVDERDNCASTPNPGQADADGDRTGDVCDVDADGDFVRDDLGDNCPGVPNPNQEDADADGAGDACDSSPGTGSGRGPGAGPGGDGGSGAPLDRTRPSLTLGLRSRVRVSDLVGRLPVSVRCDEACALSARLGVDRRTARRARLGRKAVTVARGSAALAGRGRTYVFMRPRRGMARRLELAGRVKAALQIVAVDAAGNRRTAVRRLVVLR